MIRNILADFVEQHGLARRSRPATVSTRKKLESLPDAYYEPDEPADLDDLCESDTGG
ncbi:MAG: hypothetical protein GYA24_05840 [Candidatus Lokiarchaeota archaeon]|nr:hypothetical protein [Candidatus Lokiarchaeota archaeon]